MRGASAIERNQNLFYTKVLKKTTVQRREEEWDKRFKKRRRRKKGAPRTFRWVE